MKAKEPIIPPKITTIEELIKEYGPASELAKDLDYALLCLVTLLRHEPEHAKSIIAPYQTIRELKHLLENQSNLPR